MLYLHHAGLAGTDQNNETGWDNCVHLTLEIGSGDDYGGVFTHRAVDEDGNRFETQERYPHFVLAPHANSPAYGFGGGVAGSATGAVHSTRPLLMGILEALQDPNTTLLAKLKDMPIWSMCGTNDSYFAGAQAMADGMEQIGATAFTFTAMQGSGGSLGGMSSAGGNAGTRWGVFTRRQRWGSRARSHPVAPVPRQTPVQDVGQHTSLNYAASRVRER